MKLKLLALFGLVCAVLVLPARAALSYYFDTHLCFDPIGLVSDDQRVKRAVSSFKDLAFSKPEVQYLDDPKCCRTVKKKIASDYAIQFKTVLLGRQAKFVEVKTDNPEIGPFYLRSDVCGYYVAHD